MPNTLSNKTLVQLREYFVQTSLREIVESFGAAGIICGQEAQVKTFGKRRSLVEQYYRSLNLSNADDVAKLLAVYASALVHLHALVDGGEPQRIPQINVLKKRLKKDGFVFERGRIRAMSPKP